MSVFILLKLPSYPTGSVVSLSCGKRTGEPELQRRRRPSSNITPSASPSVNPSWSAYSCQISWTAVYLLIPLYPSPSPRWPLTSLTLTPTGPWGIFDSSRPRLLSSRLHWRRGWRSFPRSPLTSGLRSAPARLSRRPTEPCRPNRCLCWRPSLTSSPDPQRGDHGPARWDRLRINHNYLHRLLPDNKKIFWCKYAWKHPQNVGCCFFKSLMVAVKSTHYSCSVKYLFT